jgi:hypothetical protein
VPRRRGGTRQSSEELRSWSEFWRIRNEKALRGTLLSKAHTTTRRLVDLLVNRYHVGFKIVWLVLADTLENGFPDLDRRVSEQ